MDDFPDAFARLVAANAHLIFTGSRAPSDSPANYQALVGEMSRLSHDVDQAARIADAIESNSNDVFRNFDLETFVNHFDLDAIQKTTLALAFKASSSSQELKRQADTILTANLSSFVDALSRPIGISDAAQDAAFVSRIIDEFVQYPPPAFNAASKAELRDKVCQRYLNDQVCPPAEVLAALDLVRVLADKPVNSLALYIQRVGADFTRDTDSCFAFIQSRPPTIQLSEEQVSVALTYTTVSQSPQYNPSVLTAALRPVLPTSFSWQNVIAYFDQRYSRVSSSQFLRLYKALDSLCNEGSGASFDIQSLWGGHWENAETQLSYICAFGALGPNELDASTIRGLERSIVEDIYARASESVQQRAALAARHPLSSVAALSAIFHSALHSTHASTTVEAKRLFQTVVVPNLDIFVVTAFEVPLPWADIALSTVASLFARFTDPTTPHYDFVLFTIWTRHQERVISILTELRESNKLDLQNLVESAANVGILPELVHIPNELGCELALQAHLKNFLDLGEWAKQSSQMGHNVSGMLNKLLSLRATEEIDRHRDKPTTAAEPSGRLTVRMVSALLQVLEDHLPKSPMPQLIDLQRLCIAAYPRLVNYGEGYDDIIDANGVESNTLMTAANTKMEEHYRKMYNHEMEVRDVVELLNHYKHSRDPLDQDIFACMIHGLLDEYGHYGAYPVEALATTAVLFGGILARRLVPDLALKVGLGMILEAVKDHNRDASMFKFGLQALIHLLGRFPEWPGFCAQLLQIPDLIGTEPWIKAREVVQLHDDDLISTINPVASDDTASGVGSGPLGKSQEDDAVATGPAFGNLAQAVSNGFGELDASDLASQHGVLCPFTAVNPDTDLPDAQFEDPNTDVQGRIQFVLNNLTDVTLHNMYAQLRALLETNHQRWFAGHLVDERAKMQPNYHHVYLELVKLMDDGGLWAEILRATYMTVRRSLNSEVVMHNSTERSQLKNLGQWLGLLTIGRDQPIKHSNIAFRQLLMEAFDSGRLIVVIPFVCKVLVQSATSSIFRPPNPWLMDLVRLLVELYHHANLKLNLKFEIEVLCQDLTLDLRSIEPTYELANRLPGTAGVASTRVTDGAMDGFDGMALGSLGASLAMSSTSTLHIPDVSDQVHVPPISEMVIPPSQLSDIVRKGFDYAVREIIAAVVERSVTIAAIATANMVRKDFATEGDESRIRDCAAKMAKATAGSLALVTSKDPMRAHLTNYIRNVSAELPQGLPEGTIMMCVNSNLELGCSVIERAAEERAVPEIEEMIRPDLEARRHHRAMLPNEPYVDPSLTRWAMAMPGPFKLSPSAGGLNREQMAIYEEFARQPRTPGTMSSVLAHTISGSDATRSMTNEVFQEHFLNGPPTAIISSDAVPPRQQSVQPSRALARPPPPTQTQAAPQPHLLLQQPQQQQLQPPQHGGGLQLGPLPFATTHVGMSIRDGMGARATPSYQLADQQILGSFQRLQKLVQELQRVASEASENHFQGLPRPHPVLDVVDTLVQLTIKTSQTAEEFPSYAADLICNAILGPVDDSLALESLVHVLETLRKMGVPGLETRVAVFFHQQPAEQFLSLPLITALVRTDLLDWTAIDGALASAIDKRDPEVLGFLGDLLELTLLNDRPILLFSDLAQTLEAAWAWMRNDSVFSSGTHQRLRSKLVSPSAVVASDTATFAEQELLEYVFEEWTHRHESPNGNEQGAEALLSQLQATGVLRNKESLFLFLRTGVNMSVEAFEQACYRLAPLSSSLASADAVVHLFGILLRSHSGVDWTGAAQLADSVLALFSLLLAHHHATNGDAFNQKVFHRLFSGVLEEIADFSASLGDAARAGLMCRIATRLSDIGPRYFPGFAHAWLLLIQQPVFLGCLAGHEDKVSRSALASLLCQHLEFLGDLVTSSAVPMVVKDVYRATLKLLLVLQHDFPDFLATCCMQLCASIPTHCTQLLGIVLTSTRTTTLSMIPAEGDDQNGDRPVNSLDSLSVQHAVSVLEAAGLKDLVDLVLRDGPFEDAIAHLSRAFVLVEPPAISAIANMTVPANRKIIAAFTVYAGYHATHGKSSEPQFDGPEAATIALLARELPTAIRYHLLQWIVNQLRLPDSVTTFFHRLLLDIFAHDMEDPEDGDIRQQITRIILERLVGYLPQPWGFMVTVHELVKNGRYMFFDLPFIKSTPDVAERFASILQRT